MALFKRRSKSKDAEAADAAADFAAEPEVDSAADPVAADEAAPAVPVAELTEESPPEELPPEELLPEEAPLEEALSEEVPPEELSDSRPLPELTWETAETTLMQADLGVAATARVLQLAKKGFKGKVAERLQQALLAELSLELNSNGVAEADAAAPDEGTVSVADPAPTATGLSLHGNPAVWLVVGVNGVGKTTTVAKLAKHQQDHGCDVVLAAADTFRAAAIEQLQLWADQLDAPLVKGDSGGDPAAIVFDAVEHAAAKDADLVIVDTAGRMHTKDNLMAELQKVLRVAHKTPGTVCEILLVIDSTTGQNGIAQAQAFHEAVRPTGLVLTKLDGSSKGGVVLTVQQELQLPVKFIGVGEGLGDLQPFDPHRFATDLLCAHV